MPMTDLQWLRKLLDDEQTGEAELVEGDGETATFFVRNPPVPDDDSTTVAAGGTFLQRGVVPGFFVTDGGRSITLDPVPTVAMEVVIRYSSQLWSDDELETYMAQIGHDRAISRLPSDTTPADGRLPYLYWSGLLAIDTLLSGTATGLRFGAGSEDFDIPSVFDRLMRLRAMFVEWLTQQDEEVPMLAFADIDVEIGDPSPNWSGEDDSLPYLY